MMTWTLQRPIRDGWYWVRNAALEGREGDPEPRVVQIYGFADGEPTVTIPSEENCSDLADIDAERAVFIQDRATRECVNAWVIR